MKLHNTLTQKTEEFKPIKDKEVKLYSCGPTVYDHIHIGNLSSFIAADILHRALKVSGYDVKHVMNFTDVDDKTIARSAEQYPDDEPKEALKNLTKHYSEIFINDLEAVGVDVPTLDFVNATASIDEMQKLIKRLYDQKFAYITEDGVYFSIEAYKQSGKKYGQLTDITVDSTSQARIRNDEYDKESAHDFALWKLKSGNEPSWEFELDGHQLSGRPGWHIECSAMSQATLGQPFDIHTGGVDLIFPHHENEIAQSTAGQDDPILANYFVHNEHLLVNGKKMSKSLNNFFTLRDIIEKGYDPLAFRLMVLQSHYRNQSNFTWEILEAAQNRLKDIQNFADLQHQEEGDYGSLGNDFFDKLMTQMIEALMEDLKTPALLRLLSDAMTNIEVYGKGGISTANTNDFKKFLKFIDEILGLNMSSRSDITKEQQDKIWARSQARDKKDWDQADTLRQELETEGIGIKDNSVGVVWFRL